MDEKEDKYKTLAKRLIKDELNNTTSINVDKLTQWVKATTNEDNNNK